MDKRIIVVIAAAVVVIAAVAAFFVINGDQSTTRSGENSDYGDETLYKGVMSIYGNADMNTVIDDRDVAFVKNIVSKKTTWNQAQNPFADANCDGVITQEDVDLIENLVKRVDGTQVRFVDGNKQISTATLPMKTIVMSGTNGPALMCLAIGFKNTEVLMMDGKGTPYNNMTGVKTATISLDDYDAVTSAGIPDAIIYNNYSDDNLTADQIAKYKKAGIVLMPSPSMEGADIGDFALAVGYLFDKVENAQKFCNWCNNILDTIKNGASKVKESDYPSVLWWYGGQAAAGTDSVYCQLLKDMAAKNVADWPGDYKVLNKDNCTWILDYDPDYVVRTVTFLGYDTDMSTFKPTFDTYGDMIKELRAYKDNHYVFVAGGLPQILREAYVVSYLHPDIFGADYGDKCHKELIEMYGIDYDVSQHPFRVDGTYWL